MTELYRHIGPDVDVPAGDIGVGAREVGYMLDITERIRGAFENGVVSLFTGKGLSFGGSLFRPEATGFGVAYFCQEILKHEGTDFKGKNSCSIRLWSSCMGGMQKKIAQLGGKVLLQFRTRWICL